MNVAITAVAAATLLIACLLTSLMRRWAPTLGLIDVPNARSSHLIPTPRAGGIAIVLAFLAAIVFLLILGLIDVKIANAAIFAGGAVALIGLIDDKRPLASHIRLGVHAIAAVLATLLIGGLPLTEFFVSTVLGRLVGEVFTLLTILWSVNLFNFMDGIDGIAGAEAAFIASGATFLNLCVGGDPGISAAMLCMAAANIGFLVFNWPPASIFMGDVGSGFLGMALAIFAIRMSQVSEIPIEVWPILGGVFLVDATVTLLRRMIRGDRWREAHRAHAYQRLAIKMGGHRPVTLSVMAINVLWLLPWAWYASMHRGHEIQSLVAALTPIVVAAWLLGTEVQLNRRE